MLLVGEYLPDAAGIGSCFSSNLAQQGAATQALQENLTRSSNGANLPHDVDRKRNQTRMTFRRSPDRLLDHQGGIGREPETQSVIEPLDRPRECQIPFLDEVEHRNVVMRVLTGDPDAQTQIGLDQNPLGTLVSGFLTTKELTLFSPRQHRHPAYSAGVQRQ